MHDLGSSSPTELFDGLSQFGEHQRALAENYQRMRASRGEQEHAARLARPLIPPSIPFPTPVSRIPPMHVHYGSDDDPMESPEVASHPQRMLSLRALQERLPSGPPPTMENAPEMFEFRGSGEREQAFSPLFPAPRQPPQLSLS